MFEKQIKLIVIILSTLIFFAFIAILYGIYTKITPKPPDLEKYTKNISLFLDNEQFIKNFQVIDKNLILINVESNNEVFAIIYDIKKNKIIKKIVR